MSGGDSPCARFWGFYSKRDGPQELVCSRAALANPFYPASRETSYFTGEEPLQVQMLGSVENFDAHDPVIFSEVQHDVVGETIVDDLLLPVIQTKVKRDPFGHYKGSARSQSHLRYGASSLRLVWLPMCRPYLIFRNRRKRPQLLYRFGAHMAVTYATHGCNEGDRFFKAQLLVEACWVPRTHPGAPDVWATAGEESPRRQGPFLWVQHSRRAEGSSPVCTRHRLT